MTDSAPATPVPAVDPATVPKVSMVESAARAVTSVATAAAATAWTWATWLTTFAPSINQSIVVVVTAVVTVGSTLATQHLLLPSPKMVIQAADAPKAEPIRVVLQPLDKLEARAAAIEAKLDTLIQQTAPKAPVVIPKRTKSAAR